MELAETQRFSKFIKGWLATYKNVFFKFYFSLLIHTQIKENVVILVSLMRRQTSRITRKIRNAMSRVTILPTFLSTVIAVFIIDVQ